MSRVPQSKIRRVLDPDWVRAADVPHRALRYAETLIKRQILETEDRAVVDVFAQYRDAFRAFRSQALDLSDQYGVRNFDGSQRSSKLMRDAVLEAFDAQAETLKSSLSAASLRWATRAYLGGYYGRAWAMDVSTKDDVNIQAAPIDEIGAAYRLREDVFDALLATPEFAEWRLLYGIELDDLMIRVRRMVTRAMLDGQSIDDIMNRVRDLMGLPVDWANYGRGTATILKGTYANFSRVQTLVRTAVNDASNTGALSIFQQNADVLSGYQWIVARDERVCPSCLEKANRVYNINDVERPPLHPNCRCTIIPVIRTDWMIAADAPPRRDFNGWLDDAGLTGLITPARAGDSRRIG